MKKFKLCLTSLGRQLPELYYMRSYLKTLKQIPKPKTGTNKKTAKAVLNFK